MQPRDVKAADHDGDAIGAELTAEIEGAGKLVRLHADQADHAGAGRADALGHAFDVDDGITLVASLDFDIDVGAEHAVIARTP